MSKSKSYSMTCLRLQHPYTHASTFPVYMPDHTRITVMQPAYKAQDCSDTRQLLQVFFCVSLMRTRFSPLYRASTITRQLNARPPRRLYACTSPGVAIIRVRKQEPVYTRASFRKLTNYENTCEDRQALVSGHELLQRLVTYLAYVPACTSLTVRV